MVDVPVRQPEDGFIGQSNFSARESRQAVLNRSDARRLGLLVADLLFKVFDVGGKAIGQGHPSELKQVLAASLLPRRVLPGLPNHSQLLPGQLVGLLGPHVGHIPQREPPNP